MTTPITRIDNARLGDGRLARLTLRDGRFLDVAPMDGGAAGTNERSGDGAALDLDGALVLPALFDGHLHLDKTLMGLPWIPHGAGPERTSRIENDKKVLPFLPVPTRQRAGLLIARCIAHGTGYLRSHVDIDTDCRLDRFHEVLRAREDYAGRADVQLVAFPQSGVVSRPGTLALIEEAVREGADLVGGMDPCAIDRDPAGQLDGIFAIAERHGVGMDIHLHETGELGLFSLQEICRRTQALGLQGRVTVSHGFCLGTVAESSALAAAELMARSDVMLATHGAAKWPLPPIALLRRLGVTVFAGNDDVRDTWSPYGTGDVLARAALIGWRADYRSDEQVLHAFELVSASAARAFGVEGDYGIRPGARADFFTVQAENTQEALASHPPRGWVFKGGRAVARDGALLPQ